MTKIRSNILAVVALAVCCGAPVAVAESVPAVLTGETALLGQRLLGNLLFSDVDLSEPPGQSCASCHSAARGFADPDATRDTAEGARRGLHGARNAPALGYARYTPPLYFNAPKDTWVGGLFVDGRAPTLEDQAGQPLLNPIEMGNPDKATVVAKVARAPYAWLARSLFGDTVFDNVERAFAAITSSLATFERSEAFAPFSSKFDHYLDGKAQLSAKEAQGLALFADMNKGNCASCHVIAPLNDGKTILLTDFSYDNVGVPRNPDNRFYAMAAAINPAGRDYVDRGLGAVVGYPEEMGKFKTPTLRNVAVTAPYMHNGYFKDLKSIVQFYNDRDIRPACADRLWTRAADAQAQGCWPAAEVKENVNASRLGDLGLSDEEVDAIVAFLETLTDGWRP